MEYLTLLFLLLSAVSTDGLSVTGGWSRGNTARVRNELSVSIHYRIQDFPDRAPNYYLAYFPPKLHEMKKCWARGWRVPCAPLIRQSFFFFRKTLANLQGPPGKRAPWIQCLSFSCNFCEQFCQIIRWRHYLWGCHSPSEKSRIRID